MNKTLMKKYAKLIANKGIGLRNGQQVSINAPVYAYEFVSILVEELYNSGTNVLNFERSSEDLIFS